jgi:hypothetical protein
MSDMALKADKSVPEAQKKEGLAQLEATRSTIRRDDFCGRFCIASLGDKGRAGPSKPVLGFGKLF